MKRGDTIDDLLVHFETHVDMRGSLDLAACAGKGNNLPFHVRRVFWITNVPEHSRRGMHAHRTCWEVVVAVCGSFKISIDNGVSSALFHLDSSHEGVLIPPMHWCELFDFSDDAVCLCMASGEYDKDGYINDYDSFVEETKGQCQ